MIFIIQLVKHTDLIQVVGINKIEGIMDKKLELEKNIKMLIKTNKKEKELKEKRDNYFYDSEDIRKNAIKNGIFTSEDNKKLEELKNKKQESFKQLEITDLMIKNIKNNIDLLCYHVVEEELFNILRKYKGKRVGKQTIEKIQEEMQKYLEDNYKINLNFYFNIYEPYTGIDIKKIYFSFDLKDIYFSSSIEYYYYTEEKRINIDRSYDYEYIKPEYIEEYSKNMQEDSLKTESKLKALKEEYNKVAHDFNDNYAHNNTLTKQFKVLI